MKTIQIPDFKLSNVINNILLYSKLTDNTGVFSSDDKIYETIETVINDIRKNPLILNYFNYSEEEHYLLEDVILNGLDYPGVYDDFISEIVRKNKLAIFNELTIYITFSLINKNKNFDKLFNQIILNARKTNSHVKFNK